jgi:hypothetical protein
VAVAALELVERELVVRPVVSAVRAWVVGHVSAAGTWRRPRRIRRR